MVELSPSTRCGKIKSAVLAGNVSSAGGAEFVEMRNTPWNGRLRDSNCGIWFKKSAVWPLPGTSTVEVSPVGVPSSKLKANVTGTGLDEAFDLLPENNPLSLRGILDFRSHQINNHTTNLGYWL